MAGIYAVRCLANGRLWVGYAPDLSTIGNRIWFTLKHGSMRHRSLQDAWNEHGADNFTLEVVEQLKEEALPFVRDRIRKERLAHWSQSLGAECI